MQPLPIKPKKAEAWACPSCGKAYEEEGPCRLCIRNHMRVGGIHIKGPVLAADSEHLYKEGDRWPFLLEMWCGETETNVLYRRVPNNEKPSMRAPRKKPGPLLG